MKVNFDGDGDGFKVQIIVKWATLIPLLLQLIFYLGLVATFASLYNPQILDWFGL
jgi:hypothetical protein